jgi:hypothetical protein
VFRRAKGFFALIRPSFVFLANLSARSTTMQRPRLSLLQLPRPKLMQLPTLRLMKLPKVWLLQLPHSGQ